MVTHLCDVNVWLALVTRVHEHHGVTTEWLATIHEPSSVVFVRPTQQALLRLLTTQAVFTRHGLTALSDRAAWAAYDALLADERIALRTDEPLGLETRWRDYTMRDSPTPKLWMDAWLAAFAVSAGYQLVTTDQAFTQFNGLDVLVPG